MVQAVTSPDGSTDLTVAGERSDLAARDVQDARTQVLERARQFAADAGRPVLLSARDPHGSWLLTVQPDGQLEVGHADADTPGGGNPAETAGYDDPPAATPIADPEPPPALPAKEQQAPAVNGAAVAPRPPAQNPWPATPLAPTPRREAPAPAVPPAVRSPSFLRTVEAAEPARTGWRGFLARTGFDVKPSEAEQRYRDDVAAVSRHWGGPRTVIIANGKGGSGKALADNEPVLSPQGYRPISELRVGDLVMGTDGLAYPVLGVFPQGDRDLFRVTLSDGTSILADRDHLWDVHTPLERGRLAGSCTVDNCDRPVLASSLCRAHYGQQQRGTELTTPRMGDYARIERTLSGGRLMTTAELLGARLSAPHRGYRRSRYFIPTCSALKFDAPDLPLDPYLLGLLLGDGALSDTTPAFSTADPELAEAVASTLPEGCRMRYKGRYDYRLTRQAVGGANPLKVALAGLGLAGLRSADKHIPELYKYADIDARLAVLQGILDTDGSIDHAAATLTSVSRQLVDDAKFIAESLGCVVTRHAPFVGMYTHAGGPRPGQVVHRIRITRPDGLDLFRLERKRRALLPGQRRPYRAIVAVEPAGRGSATCISVATPDRLFLTRNCVPTHNTPLTIGLSAVFARYGGGAVCAWGNHQLRGTLGWHTVQNPHAATTADLLAAAPGLLEAAGRLGDLARYTHHQPADKYDVLQADPTKTADKQRSTHGTVATVHQVLSRYYRLILIDSDNDESAPHWLGMLDHADLLVVASTNRDVHAETGRLMLEDLKAHRGPKARQLVENAVVIVSATDTDEAPASTYAKKFSDELGLRTATIPYDRGMKGVKISFDNLQPATQRAYLAAGAVVANALT